MKQALPVLLAFVIGAAALPAGAAPRVTLRVEGKLGALAEVVQLRHRDALRSGDGLRFELRDDQRAYVYLLALGSSGHLTVLQPYSGSPEDALQAPDTTRLIPADRSFLPVDDTPGTETLFAFASEQPVDGLQGLVADLGALSDPAKVHERLERRFPGLVVVELQHLPGLVTLRQPLPPVSERPAGPGRGSGGNAGTERPEHRGLFGDSSVPEEPGVLSDEGAMIRSLLKGTSVDRPAPLEPAPGEKPGTAAAAGKSGLAALGNVGPAPPSPSSAPAREPATLVSPAPGTDSGSAMSPVDPGTDAIGGALVLLVTPSGTGTGVVAGARGEVLTSWHQVDGQSSISVFARGPGGSADASVAHAARVVRHNEFTDLALLVVDPPLPGNVFITVAPRTEDVQAGEQVHVLSQDQQQVWHHDFAMVVQAESERSWFSGDNVIHRGPALRVQMKTPPSGDGAPILDAQGRLVGLKVRSRGESGMVTAVGASAIRAFLNPDRTQ